MKLWAGRFQKETDDQVNDFNSSISFDARLYKQDITGSMAHAAMLGKQGIIPQEEAQAIIDALVVRPASMSPLSATFAKPVDTGAGIAASEVSMSATVSKKALKVNVIWSLQKAEWNKGVTSSAPTIPASYTRLTTTGLINLLKKL